MSRSNQCKSARVSDASSTSRISRTSAARIRANRANAKKSTGPRTPEGKARSRVNASTHNIFSSDIVVQGESREMFNALRIGMLAEHRPQTLTELFLVEQMVQSMWRMKRAQAAEALDHACANDRARHLRDDPDYQRQREENLDECNDDDFGEESEESPKEPEYPDKVPDFDFPGSTTLLVEMSRAGQHRSNIEKLHAYEKRLEGTFHRSLKELRKLRTVIRDEVVPDRHCPFLTQEEADSVHPVVTGGIDHSAADCSDPEMQTPVEQSFAPDDAKMQNEPNEVAAEVEMTSKIGGEPSPRPSPGVPGEGGTGTMTVSHEDHEAESPGSDHP